MACGLEPFYRELEGLKLSSLSPDQRRSMMLSIYEKSLQHGNQNSGFRLLFDFEESELFRLVYKEEESYGYQDMEESHYWTSGNSGNKVRRVGSKAPIYWHGRKWYDHRGNVRSLTLGDPTEFNRMLQVNGYSALKVPEGLELYQGRQINRLHLPTGFRLARTLPYQAEGGSSE